MDKIKKIMDELNTINYGFLDNDGNNIFDDDLNIENTFNKVYYLMSPKELLEKKYGVCWDQVELERYFFEELDISFKTYFIYIDDHNYLPSHTFLVYEENGNYYWFEHSWYDEKGIHEYHNLNELLNDVSKKHLISHRDEIDGDYETYIYEYTKPDFNISCDDFYNFIYKQKRIYNYILEDSKENDLERIKYYKLRSIVDYANNLSEEEMNKIDNYIQQNVPNQLKDYKNIKYNGAIIGCLLVSKDNEGILLDEIYLEEEYRNKGIGSSIIKKIIDDAEENIYLWVYKNNIKAYNLYKKMGFKVIDETESRYQMKYTK